MSRHRSDHRPVGFTFSDSSAYCRRHVPDGIDTNAEDVYAVFSWTDDAYTVTCDVSGMSLSECCDDGPEKDSLMSANTFNIVKSILRL